MVSGPRLEPSTAPLRGSSATTILPRSIQCVEFCLP